MYIVSGTDAAPQATDGTATAGRNYILPGCMLKVAGTDESIGITLTDSEGKVTTLTDDLLTVNKPMASAFIRMKVASGSVLQ